MLALTRGQALDMLTSNVSFMSYLKKLKAAVGYASDCIVYLDDSIFHTNINNPTRSCTDVIASILLDTEGVPITEGIWIYPGFSDSGWGRTQAQAPLYVGVDNQIHLGESAQGSILHGVGKGSKFDDIIRAKQKVFVTDMRDGTDPVAFEAHIYLSIEELDALQ
jgi:hypothetical protein